MIVHVHADSSITLDDADTFSAFSVEAGEITIAEIVAALGSDASVIDDEHVWIPIERLYTLGATHGGPDWRAGCHGMIQFATSMGWVDEAKQKVRAHVER